MSNSTSKHSAWIHSHRLLFCTKLLAVILSLMFAIPHLPIVGVPQLNFITATFAISIMALIPSLGRTTPCLIIGFWLSPILFAFRVNGSATEDLTAAIVGGMNGCLIGMLLDYKKHQTKIIREESIDAMRPHDGPVP